MIRIITIAFAGMLACSGVASAGTSGDIPLAGGCGQADLLFLGIDLDLDVDKTAYKNMTDGFLDSSEKSANKVGKALKKAKTEAKRVKGVKKAYNYCVDEGLIEPDEK